MGKTRARFASLIADKAAPILLLLAIGVKLPGVLPVTLDDYVFSNKMVAHLIGAKGECERTLLFSLGASPVPRDGGAVECSSPLSGILARCVNLHNCALLRNIGLTIAAMPSA